MSRVLGIDLGSRRIGIAVSDSDRTLATPIEVVQRSRDRARDHRNLAELVREWEVALVVVGMPYGLDGKAGRAAVQAQAEADRLGDVLPVPVETYDERLSTVIAERSLMEQQMKADARRQVVDKVAAAVILQSWLDAHRGALDEADEF